MYSTDEDARQAMATDGGMLKQSRVKLFLSSRNEMQKIIEQARQQHLAMQGGGDGAYPGAAPPLRQPFAAAAVSQQPADMGMVEQPHHHHQQQQPFVQNQRMLHVPGGGGGGGGSAYPPPPMIPHSMYGGNVPPQGGPQYGAHVVQNNGHMPGPAGPMYGSHVMGGDTPPMVGGVRDPRGMMAESDRMRDMERGGGPMGSNRRGERARSRDRGGGGRREGSNRDMVRRGGGKRSRSRSRSRGRERRHRSRSSSRERRRSRDRERNNKAAMLKVGAPLLPNPQEELELQNAAAAAAQRNNGEPNTSIQLRMLSGDLTYRDIREYLSGINVPNTCIKMINAFDGYRFGLAYIRFTLQSDKQKAMARHSGVIRGFPAQIYHVEDSVFNQAIDSYCPGVAIDGKDLSRSCLAFRDFPPNAGEQHLREALCSIQVAYVLPERDDNGGGGGYTGLCYAQLASEADARKAVQVLKAGVLVCGRQVKAALLPLEELEKRRRSFEMFRDDQQGPMSPDQQQHGGIRSRPMGFGGGGEMSNSKRVFISGLPPNAVERDIGDFFSDVGVIPQHIEIVCDDNRVPTGNAYCTFASAHEADRALDKNEGFLGAQTVNVVLVESHEQQQQQQPMMHAQQQDDMHAGHYMNSQVGGPRAPMYGPGSGYAPRPMIGGAGRGPDPQMAPRYGGPQQQQQRFPGGGSGGGNGGGGGGGGGGPNYMARQRPPMNMRMRMPMGPNMGPSLGPDSRMGSPGMPDHRMASPVMGVGSNGPMGSASASGFGAPGCVVAISNVPHKAVILDILDFFRGFQINEKCIIRRFGPNGQPTGDARVAFPSPDEAQLAVRTLQNEYMLNRRVALSII